MKYECTECGCEIEDDYLIIGGNHAILALLSDVENCFCSTDCAMDFLMVIFKQLLSGDVPYELEDEE